MAFPEIYWAFPFTYLGMSWRRQRQAMAKWRLGRRKWRGPDREVGYFLKNPLVQIALKFLKSSFFRLLFSNTFWVTRTDVVSIFPKDFKSLCRSP